MNLARLVLHINERQEALWDQVDLDRVYLLGEVNFGRHDIKSVFGSTRGAMGAVVNHIYDIYVRIAEDFGRYELKAVYSALTPAELKELLTAWLFSAGPTGGREVQFPR